MIRILGDPLRILSLLMIDGGCSETLGQSTHDAVEGGAREREPNAGLITSPVLRYL